jgi:hypothetical protein
MKVCKRIVFPLVSVSLAQHYGQLPPEKRKLAVLSVDTGHIPAGVDPHA